MTSTQPVDLSGRFRLAPDEVIRDWIEQLIDAAEAGEGDLYISPSWNPREAEQESTIDLLVQTAVGENIILCPDGITLDFGYDGSTYWFGVEIGRMTADQVTLATWGYEMRKLGDGQSTGAEAVTDILAEAVYLANGSLDRLQRQLTVPGSVRAAIEAVVAYNWDAERADYEQNFGDPDDSSQQHGQVWECLRLLRHWLDGDPA